MEAPARVLPDRSAAPLHHCLDLFQDKLGRLVVALHPGCISRVQPWETLWVFTSAVVSLEPWTWLSNPVQP